VQEGRLGRPESRLDGVAHQGVDETEFARTASRFDEPRGDCFVDIGEALDRRTTRRSGDEAGVERPADDRCHTHGGDTPR
jgi:hypothetical protein